MKHLLSDIKVFMEDAIEVLQVNGLVVKADAYKLLGEVQTALAEPQREWVGLTVEELTDIADFYMSVYGHVDLPHTFARQIEAKLKEKNT